MLAKAIINKYKAADRCLILLESMTGGGVASAITRISGASHVLWASLVLYQWQAKHNILNIDPHYLSPERITSQESSAMMLQQLNKFFLDTNTQAPKPYTLLVVNGFADGLAAGTLTCGIQNETYQRFYQHEFSGSRPFIQQQSVAQVLRWLYEFD